jgi:hypothetical protein
MVGSTVGSDRTSRLLSLPIGGLENRDVLGYIYSLHASNRLYTRTEFKNVLEYIVMCLYTVKYGHQKEIYRHHNVHNPV